MYLLTIWLPERKTLVSRKCGFRSFQQGSLTEGEASVQLASLLRSAPLYIENIIYFFTKQVTLKRSFTVLCIPPQLVFPALRKGLNELNKDKYKNLLFIHSVWGYRHFDDPVRSDVTKDSFNMS